MPHTNNKLSSLNTIDTDVGLKYLNGNDKLYLKILNNFLIRYRDTTSSDLNEESWERTLHSIKGLSATLGMGALSKATIKMELSHKKESSFIDFFKKLSEVIAELETLFVQNSKECVSTVLIIEDNRENIDELIEILDNYDILIALNRYEALEVFDQEKIDMVLLNSKLNHTSGREIFDFLKQHTSICNMTNIFIDVPVQAKALIKEIEEKLNINDKKAIFIL